MSDESWTRRQRDEDDFGPPLFGDEPTGEIEAPNISFGDGSTGPLPHWTDPPTGEMPRVLADGADPEPAGEMDVWSSFSGKSPVWSDDSPADDITGAYDVGPVAASSPFDETSDIAAPIDTDTRREPPRITIGTDPTGDGTRRPRQGDGRNGRSGKQVPPPRPGTAPTGGTAGRDMPTAVAVGVAMAAIFLVVIRFAPVWAALALVTVVIGLASVEYFDKVTEKGYRPANIAGILACVFSPVMGYWAGERGLPLVMLLALVVAAVTFITGPGIDQAPMPNMAITSLGTTWIGLTGAFGGVILTLSKPDTLFTAAFGDHVGTDTLCLIAIGVVANDVGALFIGSAVGKTPLRPWISPNKSVQGLLGGTVATLLAMVVADRVGSTTWNSLGDLLLLGVVISVFAPLGDLTESMFKRNLDTKDFGSLVKGHGGVLDRFDGFLFVLPAVWYLLQVLQPWLS